LRRLGRAERDLGRLHESASALREAVRLASGDIPWDKPASISATIKELRLGAECCDDLTSLLLLMGDRDAAIESACASLSRRQEVLDRLFVHRYDLRRITESVALVAQLASMGGRTAPNGAAWRCERAMRSARAHLLRASSPTDLLAYLRAECGIASLAPGARATRAARMLGPLQGIAEAVADQEAPDFIAAAAEYWDLRAASSERQENEADAMSSRARASALRARMRGTNE
jgi:hypothetical protein